MPGYNYDDDDDGGGERITVTEGTLESIDGLVEGIADETKQLARKLVGQLDYLQERHKLLRQLQTLEPHAADHFGKPMTVKQLEQRVALLAACQNVPADLIDLSTDKLKERIAAIETINRLEPNGEHKPIKGLRERARLLREVEEADGEDAPASLHLVEDETEAA
jgi:predicted RNase H-like nuclease (RuvC/YqgF family)